MPEAPRMPSIPTPVSGDINNLSEVVVAMKMALELMMGTRGSEPVARTFVTEATPKAMNTGDFWLQPNKKFLSCWTGANWQLLIGGP